MLAYFVNIFNSWIKLNDELYILTDAPNVFAGQPEVVKGSDRSAHITCEVDAVPPAQVSCAGVTRRFHKTPFRGFFLCAGLVDFFTYVLAPFLTTITSVNRTYTFYTYRNKLTKLLTISQFPFKDTVRPDLISLKVIPLDRPSIVHQTAVYFKFYKFKLEFWIGVQSSHTKIPLNLLLLRSKVVWAQTILFFNEPIPPTREVCNFLMEGWRILTTRYTNQKSATLWRIFSPNKRMPAE
jgi:hypothetical protein